MISLPDNELHEVDGQWPSKVFVKMRGASLRLTDMSQTGYCYAYEDCGFVFEDNAYVLKKGMVACLPGLATIFGGRVFVVVRVGYLGLFSIAGPIEPSGRLKYIDGCTDTILVHPPRLGDPCMNHLHFPAEINQTMHTHPSGRVGVVAKGKGVCRTPEKNIELVAGMAWVLPQDTPHAFMTESETMDVIAWHPDSDTGPTDDDHPMLNRTIVDGVSAAKIDSIRTK